MKMGRRKILWSLGLALVIGGAFLLAIIFGSCTDNVIKEAPAGCVEFWFNRYQTLAGALVALAAAWIAVKPVWKQLNLASVQIAVALQGAISNRVKFLSIRADKIHSRLAKFETDLWRGYRDTEDTGAFVHWVWEMDQMVGAEIKTLAHELTENVEGDEATISRTKLIRVMRDLESCL